MSQPVDTLEVTLEAFKFFRGTNDAVSQVRQILVSSADHGDPFRAQIILTPLGLATASRRQEYTLRIEPEAALPRRCLAGVDGLGRVILAGTPHGFLGLPEPLKLPRAYLGRLFACTCAHDYSGHSATLTECTGRIHLTREVSEDYPRGREFACPCDGWDPVAVIAFSA